MPNKIRDFSAKDWHRLRPLTQTIKTLRYNIIDRLYRRRRAVTGDVAEVAHAIRDRNVLITVAYADPQLLSWQTRLLRYYIPAAVHVIVDNSPSDEIAAENSRVAGAGSTFYLRAPPNPWSATVPSRSHGLALNWAWDNVVRPGMPHAFGFIDHDLFPTAATDPFASLATQDVYGVVRRSGARWFLWAGFCMFRFAAVKDKPLDFGQDWFVGLDTGGGNWKPLYSLLDLANLREEPSRFVPFKPDIATVDGPLQWCGAWLHEVGLMGDRRLRMEKRAAVGRLLAPHLKQAAEADVGDLAQPALFS